MPASLRLLTTCALASLWTLAAAAGAAEIDYTRDVQPIFKAKCYACHGALKQEGGLRLDTGQLARQGGDGGACILPGDPDRSPLVARITSADVAERMPAEGQPLTAGQVEIVRAWIRAGAKSPPDEAAPADPREHWAFQPIRSSRGTIDGFVRERLDRTGLKPAAEADRVTLIRRLYLDLHGLPPAPEQVAAFAADRAPEAWARLVEKVLASPRYGERWAQHWLDVVRYADTHGYEVNTPRDNAWPYRDYVIRAFNDDKPYDRFVFEQLAGDTVGEDAATGFLVAAAVLLPGQIGADEESKRLARQDALDDVIVGTGATFLGLTLGCARCHDHKFDPFTQQDYYALQAFFAGVEYGDREMNDPARRERLARAEKLAPQVAALEARLKQFEPLAFWGRTLVIDDEDASRVSMLKPASGHETNPDGNQRGGRNDAGTAERVPNLGRGRHTWWTAAAGENVCSWHPQVAGRFRVWLSWGVRGDQERARDARYLIDADGDLATMGDQHEIARIDQRTFAQETEPSAAEAAPWSGLFDAGVHEWTETSRLILRAGESGATLAADVVVLQEIGGAAESEPDQRRLPWLRGPVNALKNTDRFAPAVARFVRFVSLATIDDNLHEPCIDELEIYAADGAGGNLALAERGAKASSSGNISETGIHQLRHVNDGRYGNGRSWISNEKGGGWVQIELPAPQSIDRVVWGRDREGHYEDRLPVRYRIDVSLDGSHWSTVASSDDRAPRGTPHDEIATLLRHRPSGAGGDLPALVAELKRLVDEQAELRKPTLVYGGLFRRPDATHVLNRGDPEQPGERIGPRVPLALGSLALALDAPERERRVALARWLTDRQNPLVARVMANRVWQFHFGRGLVDTPSDFGLEGDRPSHPELLDWLATQLLENGWSLKHLHRLILNSAVYRQSSRIDPVAAKIDGDCRLLWRYPARRLEAEVIRDSMLAASGQLNLAMGGPGFAFFKTRGGLTGFPPIEKFGPDELRRMVYSHKVRMEPVPVFGAFDCPDAGQPMPKRSQSTTALQALNLFNSPFVAEQAEALARRVEREAGPSIAEQIRRAWLVAVGRAPAEAEAEACRRVVEAHGLPTLARVILNSNEFLFIP